MNVTNIIMRGLNRDSPKKVIELFNVVLGRKKDLEKCREEADNYDAKI